MHVQRCGTNLRSHDDLFARKVLQCTAQHLHNRPYSENTSVYYVGGAAVASTDNLLPTLSAIWARGRTCSERVLP
jgi:hypothetical protein